jgi:hypothetical protein
VINIEKFLNDDKGALNANFSNETLHEPELGSTRFNLEEIDESGETLYLSHSKLEISTRIQIGREECHNLQI